MKMTTRLTNLLVLSCFFLAAPLANKAWGQCIETNLAQNLGNSVSGHTNCGQRFTASCSGDILSITVEYNTATTGAGDRILNIRDGNLPTSPIIHTQVIPLADCGLGVNTHIITASVPILLGETNSFEITQAVPNSNSASGISFNSPGAYGGGSWYSGSILAGFDITFAVDIGSGFFVDLGPDTTLCPGDSILLDAGPGMDSYTWNTGETTQTIYTDTAGTYSVTVDSAGNIANDNITIGFYVVPPIDFGADTTLCPGDTLCLDAGSTWTTTDWSNGETAAIMCTDSAGTYNVLATDANGCQSSDEIIVSTEGFPVAIIAAIDTSNCEVVDFTDGSLFPGTWEWDFGDGNSSTDQNPTNTYTAYGPYTVELVVSNFCGSDTTSAVMDVSCFTGINELLSWDLSVFPNPSSGVFTIQLNEITSSDFQLGIYAVTGELVLERTISVDASTYSEEFDLSNVAEGAYILKLTSEDGNLIKRIVVNR